MPYNILLVDDDKDFRNEFKEFFNEYDVIEAKDGLEALNILNKINVVDIVILDIRMPGLKGTKVLTEIKKINPELYTIILTGFSTEEIAIEALQAHADDYVVKPVNFIKFKEKIDTLINKKNYSAKLDADSTEAKIEKIKLYVEKNYHRVFNLNEISKIIFLSPKYLSKIFKEQTGKRFNEYKLNVKIKHAKEMLTNTGYNIDQIAYKLGYKKPESFIKIFKKITHLTPTEFRRQMKEMRE
ncbi:MAG: response regulator [Spirochaetales bacterium]|nr:response regulator [Spirochaetales bacterium]